MKSTPIYSKLWNVAIGASTVTTGLPPIRYFPHIGHCAIQSAHSCDLRVHTSPFSCNARNTACRPRWSTVSLWYCRNNCSLHLRSPPEPPRVASAQGVSSKALQRITCKAYSTRTGARLNAFLTTFFKPRRKLTEWERDCSNRDQRVTFANGPEWKLINFKWSVSIKKWRPYNSA